MKKIISLLLIIFSALGISVALLFSKSAPAYADVSATDGANFVLAGYAGYSPSDYFTDANNNSTLVNAKAITPDINYLNASGSQTKKYNYIAGSNSSMKEGLSLGSAGVVPSTEMKKIISSGEMVVRLSCGLLSLKDEDRSKVEVRLQIVVGGETSTLATLTSSKVSSNNDVYEPEWLYTDYFSLPTNTEKVVFSFVNKGTGSVFNKSKFLIFEPTLFFGTSLEKLWMETESQSLKQGQVLKLSAYNTIISDASTTQYFEYYKDIHTVKYEITSGSEYARIVGSYLYVNSDAPDGVSIDVRAKCRKSSVNAETLYSVPVTFKLNVKAIQVLVEKDFDDPAQILGQGKYFVGDYATLSVAPKDKFEFSHWALDGNLLSKENKITVKIEENQKIAACFIKTISITAVEADDKTFDGNTTTTISKIHLDGVEHENLVWASGLVGEFGTCDAGVDRPVNCVGIPTLEGPMSVVYKIQDGKLPVGKATVYPRNVTVTANPVQKVYGDEDPEISYSVKNGVEGHPLLGSLSREEGENAGVYKINIGTLQEKSPNYNIESFTSADFEIQKRELTITQTVIEEKTYNGDNIASVKFVYLNKISGDNLSIEADATFDDENVGNSKLVTINKVYTAGESKDNYYISNAPTTALGNIVKKECEIIVENQQAVYGEKIEISYDAPDLVGDDQLEGSLKIDGESAGEYIINLGDLSNPNYTLKINQATFTVLPKKINVTAHNKTKIYGDSEVPLTYDVLGLIGEDQLSGQLTRDSGENAGTYNINRGTLGNKNYEIAFVVGKYTITKRELHIDVQVDDKPYDGLLSSTFKFAMSNNLPGDDISVKFEAQFSDPNVGQNKKLTAENVATCGEDKDNYQVVINADRLVASINKKDVFVTANNIEKIYGQNDPAYSFSVEGAVEGETIFGPLARSEGENVGRYMLYASEDMIANNSNYNLIFDDKSYLQINPKDINVEIKSCQKVFGERDPKIVYSYNASQFAFEDTFDQLRTGNATRSAGEEVGRYQYQRGDLSLGDNYNVVFTPSILTIAKRDITVYVLSCEKTYGDKDPGFQFITTNTVAGVDASVSLSRERGEDVGVYRITYRSLDDPHYNIEFFAGSFSIIPRDIAVKVEDAFKFYGEEDPEFGYSVTEGRLAGDDTLESILDGEVRRLRGEDVGEYAITKGSLLASINYNLTFVPGTMTILKRDLTIEIDNSQKQYGEEDPEFTYKIAKGQVVRGDAPIGKLKREEGEVVGKYAINHGTLDFGTNYNVTVVPGEFKVVPREIEITAHDAEKIYGEEDPEFTYSITKGTLVEEDDLTGNLYREDRGKITENASIYPILLGISNDNYNITYVGAKLTIKQREIQIIAKSYSSIYGQPLIEELEYEVVGDILEGDSINGGLYKVDGTDAGEYKIRSAISLGRNYKINFVAGTYTINPIALQVSVGYNKKIYASPDPHYTVSIVDGELVRDEVLDYEVEREEKEEIGTYELTCVSLDPNYVLTTIDSILEIEKKQVYLKVEVLDKVYDGTTVCLINNPIVTGLNDNEIVLDFARTNCATFEQSEPGNNIHVVLHDFSLIGPKAENYKLTLPENLTANITHDILSENDISVSTYSSTAMVKGSTLLVEDIKTDELINDMRVVKGVNVSLKNENGEELTLDRALTMTITIKNIKNYNNLRVFAKNESGELVAVAHTMDKNQLVVSTAKFGEFIIVCDNEKWIDIAAAVCVGILLGIVLLVTISKLKKKKY